MKIVIDAGHGPETPGKRSPDGSLREYQFNSVVARYVADALLHGYEGVEILMTHDDSRDVPLKERTDRANAWKADLFVSIHANASGNDWSTAQGIETFVYLSWPKAAVTLANAVQRNLIRATGRPDRGVKAADFHVLRETRMTAILVECGFMTNREECELLKSDAYRRKCADAIVAGIGETYGLKKYDQEVGVVQKQLADLQREVASLRREVVSLSNQVGVLLSAHAMDEVPAWAREAVDAAVRAGLVDTPKGGSYDFYRVLTILHRAGLIGVKWFS